MLGPPNRRWKRKPNPKLLNRTFVVAGHESRHIRISCFMDDLWKLVGSSENLSANTLSLTSWSSIRGKSDQWINMYCSGHQWRNIDASAVHQIGVNFQSGSTHVPCAATSRYDHIRTSVLNHEEEMNEYMQTFESVGGWRRHTEADSRIMNTDSDKKKLSRLIRRYRRWLIWWTTASTDSHSRYQRGVQPGEWPRRLINKRQLQFNVLSRHRWSRVRHQLCANTQNNILWC